MLLIYSGFKAKGFDKGRQLTISSSGHAKLRGFCASRTLLFSHKNRATLHAA